MIIGGGVVPLFGKVGWEVADATLAESPAKAASTRRGNPILEVSPELEHLLRARDSVKGRRVARGVLELLCEPLNGIHHARGHLARVGHDARREDRGLGSPLKGLDTRDLHESLVVSELGRFIRCNGGGRLAVHAIRLARGGGRNLAGMELLEEGESSLQFT